MRAAGRRHEEAFLAGFPTCGFASTDTEQLREKETYAYVVCRGGAAPALALLVCVSVCAWREEEKTSQSIGWIEAVPTRPAAPIPAQQIYPGRDSFSFFLSLSFRLTRGCCDFSECAFAYLPCRRAVRTVIDSSSGSSWMGSTITVWRYEATATISGAPVSLRPTSSTCFTACLFLCLPVEAAVVSANKWRIYIHSTSLAHRYAPRTHATSSKDFKKSSPNF